ncbi:MAG TPA: OB-fold-containig protein, partial [Burkholderiaceae bacterium]
YAIQLFWHGLFGWYLPAFVAVVPAGFIGLANVHVLGGLLAKILPKDETSAVSEQTLLGRAGVVITGTARRGMAAEVKVKDSHGNAHFLMLEPDIDGEEFEQGSIVLVVSKHGALYRGIRNPHPTLITH